MRFGSRKALKGRTYCGCGEKMKRLKRIEPVFVCEACGREISEQAVKEQVLEAIRRLPSREAEIRTMIESNAAALSSDDRYTGALARRRDWYLKNLLPGSGRLNYAAQCSDESDFRDRTRKRVNGWNDDMIVRLLARVVAGERVVFKGEA